MLLPGRKSRRTRAIDKLRGGRRKGTLAGMTRSVRHKGKRSGPAKTVQGVGMAGQAAGRSGKAMAVYERRKAAGKRAPLLVSLPIVAGASVASFMAIRKMRRGVKQTAPDP